MKLNLFKKDNSSKSKSGNLNKSGDWELSNEEWQKLAQMYFSWVNRDMPIPKMSNMTDFIRLGYAFNSTVYTVISLRANAAKGVPWLVYRVKDKKKLRHYKALSKKELDVEKAQVLKEQSLEEVYGTSLNKLLDEPNPLHTLQDLIEELFVYRDTTGNSYIYAVTNPVTKEIIQLFSLPADKVQIVAGNFTDPIKGYKFNDLNKEVLSKENIAHWKYVNPLWSSDGSGLYGLSPLQAAARVINNDNSGVDSETSGFANEGVKAIVTGTNDQGIDFTKEQAEELLKKFRKYTERAKKGEGNLAFNRAPVKVHEIGRTPVDMGVHEARKYNKEVLGNVFRVHPSLLSMDASTLDNFKEARRALMTMSVLPDLDNLRDKLNNLIHRFYGEEYYIDYDIMAINELQDDIEKKAKTLNSMAWITPNEKRRATNYDDYDNEAADKIYTDMGQIPLGMSIDTSFDDEDKKLEEIRQAQKINEVKN